MAKKSIKKNWLNQYVSGTTDAKPVDLTHDENGKTYTYQNVATDETGNVIKDETGQPVIYGTNTNYVGGDLAQASKSVKGHPYLEYKRQFEQSNPKGEYILNRLWSPGMPMPDDFLANHPVEFDEDYQNEQDKYIAQQVFKNNPIKKGESRGEYLDRLATYIDENGKTRTSVPLEGILSRNANQSKSTKENLFHKSWEGIKKLTLDAIDGKDDHLIVQHIINDKNLSKAEKTEALGHYLNPSTLNTVLNTLGNAGDVISPLMILFNATTGAAVTSQEGEEGYTPLSALSGDQPANEADIETQIMADPLNLIFPMNEEFKLGSEAANAIKAANNAFEETKLGQKIGQYKKQIKWAGQAFSDYFNQAKLTREQADLYRKQMSLKDELIGITDNSRLDIRDYQKKIDDINDQIIKNEEKIREIKKLKKDARIEDGKIITGSGNPLVKATEIGKGEIINFNTGEKVSAEVNIPNGNKVTFEVNPETKTVEKTVNGSSELNISQDYINTQKENIAHIENLFPGTKVFGSSRGIAEGGLPHISHDYDVFITQEDYDKLVKGKYNHVNSIIPGSTETHDIFNGKYGAQGHVDFNIIEKGKNGNATGIRAREIFRQFHPDEYYEQAAKLKENASIDDIVIPYTPKQLLEDMNPTVKTVMDAYESTKPKHINRIDSYINYGNPDVVLEAQNQYIKSLVGSKGTLGIQFPEEAFSDIEKNKKILEKIGFIGDHEIVSRDPKKMQAAINDYYINTTTLVRAVNDNPEKALRAWDPSKGGGNMMGAGLNHTTLSQSPLGNYTNFLGIKQIGITTDEVVDPLNYIREIEYKTNGLIPFKDSEKKIAVELLNKYSIPHDPNRVTDGDHFIRLIYNDTNGPKILKEFADQTGKVLVRTTSYGSSTYVSTLKDFDDAIDSLVYGPNHLMPQVKSKLTREKQYKSFIQNISTVDIPTYEKFLETKNKLEYDLEKLQAKGVTLSKEYDRMQNEAMKFVYRKKYLIEKYHTEKLEKLKQERLQVQKEMDEVSKRLYKARWINNRIMHQNTGLFAMGAGVAVGGGVLIRLAYDRLSENNKQKYYNFYKSKCEEFKIPAVSKSIFDKDVKDRTAEEQRILSEYAKKIQEERENKEEQWNKEFNEIILESPDLSYEDFVTEAHNQGYKDIAPKSRFDDFKRDEYNKKQPWWNKRYIFADGGYVDTPDQESAEKVFYESLKPLMDNNYYGIEKEKEIERLKSEKEKEKIVDYFQTGKNNNFDFTEGMHNMSNKEDSDDDNDYFRFSKKETPEEGAKLEEKKQGLVIDDDLNLSDERARRAYVALVDRFNQLPQTRSRANQMAKMVLAQAALETGNWTSAASQVNNLSGIKYYGQSGRVASNVLAPAAEEKGYRRPYVQYDSPEDWANDMVNTLVKLYPQTLTANTVDEYAKGLVGKNYKYYGTDPSVYAKGMKAKLRTMIDPKKSYEKLSSAFEQSVNEYKEKYPNRPVPVINSGLRTTAEQQALYNNRANNPYPVAAPGTSEHEYGRAIDVGFNGAHTDQDYRNFAEIMGTHGVNWLADKDKVHFQLAEFGNGGIIDDDMGQWAHPGEVTRINSRNITMNGVSYPVLGVGANGEQILMHPEQNYIFEQGPVTEYPMKRRGRLKKAKDGGLTQYQDGTTSVEPRIKNQEEFLKNWYENRVIPVPFIQEAYDLDKPGYVQKVSNFPSITYVEKVPTPGNSGTPSSNGRVTGQYNQTANTVYITPYAQPSVPVHEFTHYVDRLPEGTYMNNIHKEIISREILPQSEVPEQYKAKYSYYTDPEEVHARIMVLRQRAGFKPDEVITKEKLEDFLKNYNGDDENINDILSLSKGIFGLSNLLNYMAVNDSEDNGVRHAKYGGRLSKYQSGSTVSEDDTKYAQFVQTLPNNLKPQNTPDDALYNLRGYWESLGKPSEFDYNQPKESDGYYHAYSRNPNTGEILKKPGHPTFIQALQEDEHVGYYPFVSPDGTIYTFGKHDIIPDGFKMYEYKRGGTTWLNEYKNAGPVKPIIVPPGDPRLQSYQDSLNLYNAMVMQNKLMSSNPINANDPYLSAKKANSNKSPISDFSIQELKKGRIPKVVPGIEYLGPVARDFKNADELKEFANLIGSKNDIKLIDYYKSLGFNDNNIMYHTSADVVHPKIKPVNTYWDGSAWSPVYQKPVRKVLTEGSEGANNVIRQQQLADAGYDITIDGVWGDKSQQAWDDYQKKINTSNKTWEPNDEDLRADGTRKGTGYLGVLNRPDGGVSSEISMGVEFDGKEVEIPTIIPTLTKEELDYLLNTPVENEDLFHTPIGESIANKAVDFARQRMSKGLSPFYQEGEERSPIPQSVNRTVKKQAVPQKPTFPPGATIVPDNSLVGDWSAETKKQKGLRTLKEKYKNADGVLKTRQTIYDSNGNVLETREELPGNFKRGGVTWLNEYQTGGPTTRYSYVLDDDNGNTVFDDNGNPIIINPTTNYTVPDWLPQVNITAPRIIPSSGSAGSAPQSNGSLAADIALDGMQFIPGPLGAAASAVGVGKNLYEGDYVGAALDLGNLVTMGGAKWLTLASDLANAAGKANKAGRLARQSKILEHASNPNLWRTTGTVRDLAKVKTTDSNPEYKNEPKKAPNLLGKKNGGWLNNYK